MKQYKHNHKEAGASVGIILLIIVIIVLIGLLAWTFWRTQVDDDTGDNGTPPTDEPFSTTIENVGFETPESVLYDADADIYLVSNINGAPTDTDRNGFISQVSPEGEVTELKWIEGGDELDLNAPKGMAIVDDNLYVSDISVVHVFDKNSGEHQDTITLAGASFLNDVAAADDGTVYVSDSGLDAAFESTGTDAIYSIDSDNNVEQVVADTSLNAPNGIVATSNTELYVVAFNGDEIFSVNTESGDIDTVTTLPDGQLDGIVRLDDDTLYVSSWAASAVYEVTSDYQASVIFDNLEAPADIGYDTNRNRLLIPLFNDDAVTIRGLE